MVRPVYDESKIPAFDMDVSATNVQTSNLFFMLGVFFVSILIVITAVTIWLRTKTDSAIDAVIEEN